MDTRYKITTADGAVFTGYVHGNGGRLREETNGLERLRMMAELGQARTVAGPAGSVLLDPLPPEVDRCADWAERMVARVTVPIAGATVEIASDEGRS